MSCTEDGSMAVGECNVYGWKFHFNSNGSIQQPEQLMTADEKRVLELVNMCRKENGLDPLAFEPTFYPGVKIRAQECFEKFSHTRPNGSLCFSVLNETGTGWNWSCGENIALGQRTPEEVMTSWMNSEGHRANILNPKFTHIAIAAETMYDSNGNSITAWVQMFDNQVYI